jgi:Family of unknown function (DUF5684)
MLNLVWALALQEDPGGSSGGGGGVAAGLGIVFSLVMFAFALLMIASMWKIFTKAGEPGWAAIVPIYNLIVLLKITGKPIWWFLLFCLPFVNFIAWIMVAIALAANFGKETGFGIGLALLSPIFVPMLAFGDAQYRRVA